jgi:hypothetical protein
MGARLAIATSAALLLATAGNAQAQTPQAASPGAKAATNRAAAIRIQTQTQLVVHGSGSSSLEDQRLLQENLRRAIYEMAAKECDLLNAVFHGECRLLQLNVSSNALDRGTAILADGANGNGAATFEVIPPSD